MSSKEESKRLRVVLLGFSVGAATVLVCFTFGLFVLWTDPTGLEVAFFLFYVFSGLTLGVMIVDLKKEWTQKRLTDTRTIAVGVIATSLLLGILVSFVLPGFLWFILVFVLCVFISSIINVRGLLDSHHYEKELHKRIAKASKLPFYSSWVTATTSLVAVASNLWNPAHVFVASLPEFLALTWAIYYILFPKSKIQIFKDKESQLEILKKKYLESKARTDELITPRERSVPAGEYDDSEEVVIVAEAIRFEHVAGEIHNGRNYIPELEDYCSLLQGEYEKLRAVVPF